jgi:glucose-1-phosphatase
LPPPAVSARAAKRLPLIAFSNTNNAHVEHFSLQYADEPQRIVFSDDLAENIEGARAYGLNAVHVTSSGDVAHALAALGI